MFSHLFSWYRLLTSNRLYDNAQLLSLYLDAWLTTSNPLFLSTVHDIATYLTSPPIQSPTGAFHASEDADSAASHYDSDHKEGAFYVWTLPDFRRAISDDRVAEMAARYWNLRPDGNVSPRYDVQGELEGQNTLSVSCSLSDLATQFSMSESDAAKAIDTARAALLSYRDRERPRPALDDKILVSWNGLAISALSRTAAALSSSDPQASSLYLSSAISAAEFISRELYSTTTKQLTRVYRKGPGAPTAFADDYAFLIAGLLDLYEATFDPAYLQWADSLQKTQINLFSDPTLGGFYGTSGQQTDILIRSKDAMDNAEPSANAVSASNLFRLASMLSDEEYGVLARKTVRAFEVEMVQHPGLFTGLMSGIVHARLGVTAVVVAGPDESSEVVAALEVLRTKVRPGVTVVRIGGTTDPKNEWLKARSEGLASVDRTREMVQVCEGTSCRIVGADGLKEVLSRRT